MKIAPKVVIIAPKSGKIERKITKIAPIQKQTTSLNYKKLLRVSQQHED